LLNQIPVAIGTLVYTVCGIAVAFVASKSLSADDYVNYSAFVSVSGIFVLGVGTAVEQETNLVYFRLMGDSRSTWRFMFPRVLVAVLILWLIIFAPFFSWQSNLFGDISAEFQLAVAMGIPGLLFACVARGIVNGRSDFRRLAVAHVVFGLGTISIPIAIWLVGVSMLLALVIGQTIAWSVPLLVLLRRSLFNKSQQENRPSNSSHLSGWLVLANVALLTNLLSSQVIFRLHKDSLSSIVVAEAQVLITVSCVASTLALGLMPQIIASYRRSFGPVSKRQVMLKRGVLLIASVLALGTALFQRIIAIVLLPRESVIPFLDALLITTPAIFLVLTLLMSGKLIAEEKVRRAAGSWLIGLLGLWLFPELLGGETLRSLSVALFVGAIVAPTTFLLIDFWKRRQTADV
jgi:hypothetical protein